LSSKPYVWIGEPQVRKWNLTISHWFFFLRKKTTGMIRSDLLTNSFGLICCVSCQSLLINGRGRYQCEHLGVSNRDQCNGSSPECTPDVVKVKPKQTYRFRIASLTSLSALSFQIEVIILQ
jgi:hypothetical protein